MVGMQAALTPGDDVITGYRDHGHMLACGMDPHGVMAELTGRARRLFQGQGRLDAHVQPREEASSAATASSAPRCRSAPAWPSPTSYAEDGGVSMTYFGDGAVQPGPGLRELQHGRAVEAAGRLRDREQPIRHGHLGASAPRPAPSSASAAPAYGIPGDQVDGMDVLAVHGRRGRGAGARPRRQGADHPRDEDLPLSRPLDVRSGQVPHARKRSQKMRETHDPIDRVRKTARRDRRRRRGRPEGDRRRGQGHRQRGRRVRQHEPEPDPSELYTDVLVEA